MFTVTINTIGWIMMNHYLELWLSCRHGMFTVLTTKHFHIGQLDWETKLFRTFDYSEEDGWKTCVKKEYGKSSKRMEQMIGWT